MNVENQQQLPCIYRYIHQIYSNTIKHNKADIYEFTMEQRLMLTTRSHGLKTRSPTSLYQPQLTNDQRGYSFCAYRYRHNLACAHCGSLWLCGITKARFHYPSWRPELTVRVAGWPVSITRFHYPSWRPELMVRVAGWPVSITRQHGPCWRVSTVNMASGNRSPINSGRQLG